MKPETREHVSKARDDLDDAVAIMSIGLAKISARSAYYAAFHAAEALIFEFTGKIAKTHSGVRSELARLMPELPGINRIFLVFLAQAYKFKEISDYGVGDAAVVSDDEARTAIDEAAVLIEQVTALLKLKPE